MRILTRLRENARGASYSRLGREVGLSVSGVRRRVKELERTGVIRGYTVVIDEKKLGNPIMAFLTITLSGDGAGITNELQHNQETREAYKITGDDSVLAKLYTPDVATLSRIIENLKQFGCVKGVGVVVVLNEIKNGSNPKPIQAKQVKPVIREPSRANGG